MIELMQGLRNKSFKYLTTELLSAKLQKHQIFTKIFGPESHTQIIEKASDFLRYFFKEDMIDDHLLSILMESSQTSVTQQKLGATN